jgi:hypothetical protein
LWLAVWLSFGAPVQAQPAESEEPAAAAEELKRQGDALMVERRYTEALAKYDLAYARHPSPALLYNRSRAYESLGQYPAALEQLEAFVTEAPAELKARVPKLDELVEETRGRVTTLTVSSNVEGARVLVNRVLIGETPIRGQRVNSGSATIEVFKDGFTPRRARHLLPGGRDYAIDFALASTAQRRGVLRVTSPVVGARAFLDGKPIGTVPAEAVVQAGTHRLRVTHPDYEDHEAQVVIEPGQTQTKDAPLAETAPVYTEWWLWTIVGTAVVGGAVAVGVYAAVTERDADSGDIPPGQVRAPIVAAPVPILRF